MTINSMETFTVIDRVESSAKSDSQKRLAEVFNSFGGSATNYDLKIFFGSHAISYPV